MESLIDDLEIFWIRKRETILLIFICIFCIIISWHSLRVKMTVASGSMEPTLMTGQEIIGLRSTTLTHFRKPQRGDIQAFLGHDNEMIIKRIIGLPGETVTFKDGKVFINGEELKEDYAVGMTYSEKEEFVVPENCYFMLGDNREESLDSRKWDNPYIDKSNFIALAIIY